MVRDWGRNRRTSPRRLRVGLRRELVHRLRLEGATYDEIAERVHAWARSQGWRLPRGYDRRHVHLDLKRYLGQRRGIVDEEGRLGIAINEERYRLLLRQVWPKAMGGSLRSVELARRLLKGMGELERMASEAGTEDGGSGGAEVGGDGEEG